MREEQTEKRKKVELMRWTMERLMRKEIQRHRGRHQKSYAMLVAALTLLSEGSPVAKDPRIISWERIA